MRRLRTPLSALALCLLLAAPSLAQPAPANDSETGSGDYVEVFDGDVEAIPEPGLETDLDAVDEAHAAYLSDPALQLERPEQDIEVADPPDPPPDWLRAFGEFLDSLAPLFRIIFWIAVALVVAGLLYFIFGEAVRLRFGGPRKPKSTLPDDVLTDLRPDADAARSLLDEADALARAGRFAEAVHLLLFRSIEDIQTRLDGGVPTSLTAREIAGLGKLPDRARRALKPIIQVVERSFFGGRDVDAVGWQEARRSYEDFAFGEGWA